MKDVSYGEKKVVKKLQIVAKEELCSGIKLQDYMICLKISIIKKYIGKQE